MASSYDFVNYVCEQLKGIGDITNRKMFGEYMIYVNKKPIILVCDNTVFVKMHDCIKYRMMNSDTGYPYDGAKLHYILDIDNVELSREVIIELDKVTPLPKPKTRKSK